MIRIVSARRLRALEARVLALEQDRERLLVSNVKLVTERALLGQAREHADGLVVYWRTRAERFLDQIGASSGIISAPTMTDPAPAPTDDMRSVFAAVGRSEINSPQLASPTPAAASTAVAPVVGVDPVVAKRAIDEALHGVGS